ncbi:MAG: ferrochelatase [Bradymonadia bacterium]
MMTTTPTTGILLVNLGTPDAPRPREVRRYLREFLNDPRVLDINSVGRFMLLNAIILPLRPRKSAEAYEKIWGQAGSPLLVESQKLTTEVQNRLRDCPVELAMRYGNPSIAAGLEALKGRGCDRLVVIPLYPQYASSSTGSSLEKVYREAATRWNTPYITAVPPFFDHPAFIDAFAQVGRPHLEEMKPDHVLFSFHGLPERHMHKSDESGSHCLKAPNCCATLNAANRNCYRAQCFATARALAARLDLAEGDWTVCFQSRLGRTPWIQPYTDELVESLPKRGIKSVAVFCPAFVADCLETIEEIGMRAEEDFKAAGGESLRLIPSLNAHPAWADAVVQLVREAAPWIDDTKASTSQGTVSA